MVLFLFVLMLLNVPKEERTPGRPLLKVVAVTLGALFLLQVGAAVAAHQFAPAPLGYEASTAAVAGRLFAPRFLYAFEATSILILAALVGAVTLAKKDL